MADTELGCEALPANRVRPPAGTSGELVRNALGDMRITLQG
jgi:hypothetical protein